MLLQRVSTRLLGHGRMPHCVKRLLRGMQAAFKRLQLLLALLRCHFGPRLLSGCLSLRLAQGVTVLLQSLLQLVELAL